MGCARFRQVPREGWRAFTFFIGIMATFSSGRQLPKLCIFYEKVIRVGVLYSIMRFRFVVVCLCVMTSKLLIFAL